MAVSANARGVKRNDSGKGSKMTPEIYFARKLAANDKKTRDKTLKKLKKWISARSKAPDSFTEEELMKLWKGLFYCMWMSDKPLIQEDLAETISSLLHSISNRQTGLRFIKVALLTLAREWAGIDTWRMEKFLMFIRRILRHSLSYLASENWNQEEVAAFSAMFSENIVNANKSTAQIKVPIGLQLHMINIFPEELAKVGKEELSSEVIVKMLQPFAKCLATTDDGRLKKEITQHVFTYLIRQSDVVLGSDDESQSKEDEEGDADNTEDVENDGNGQGSELKPPKGSSNSDVDSGEDEEVDEEEEDICAGDDEDMDDEFEAQDPRAGGVNVVLPQIHPDFSKLADMIFREASEKTVRGKNRKPMYQLVKKFRDAASGINPLKVVMPDVGSGLTPSLMRNAARKWISDELKAAKQQDEERISFKVIPKPTKSKRRKLEDAAESQNADNENNSSEESDAEMLDDDELEEGEEFSDEMDDEGLDEEEDFDEDEEDVESDSDEEDEAADVSSKAKRGQKKVPITQTSKVVASKVHQGKRKATHGKGKPESTKTVGTFEVNDDWNIETSETTTPPTVRHKKKLKTGKTMQSSWTESPMAGEIEIVIPNRKYKGQAQLKSTPPVVEESEEANNSSRRVNFILDKNMAQEPKDYQESVRKSPGIPHDPHRQPPSGGVLKRCATNAKFSQPIKRRRDPSARLFTPK